MGDVTATNVRNSYSVEDVEVGLTVLAFIVGTPRRLRKTSRTWVSGFRRRR
jgi:hypothetical protein